MQEPQKSQDATSHSLGSHLVMWCLVQETVSDEVRKQQSLGNEYHWPILEDWEILVLRGHICLKRKQ